jgi:hypothetical protein
MKGYSTFIFGILRLGYQSAVIAQMHGETLNERIRVARPPKTSHEFIALVGDGEE